MYIYMYLLKESQRVVYGQEQKSAILFIYHTHIIQYGRDGGNASWRQSAVDRVGQIFKINLSVHTVKHWVADSRGFITNKNHNPTL